MSRNAAYALSMALAGLLAAGIGLAIFGLRAPGVYLAVLPIAALCGAASGRIIPAFFFRRNGHTRSAALVAGMTCAFTSLVLGAVLFFLGLLVIDGTLFTDPGQSLVWIGSGAVLTHVLCGPFGYPLALLAALLTHAALTRETQEAAGDAPRRPPEQSES